VDKAFCALVGISIVLFGAYLIALGVALLREIL
jgi:hypothetical protein